MALLDKKGNLVTNSNGIKNLALKAITERLRQRPMHPNLKSMEKAKKKADKVEVKNSYKKKKSRMDNAEHGESNKSHEKQ